MRDKIAIVTGASSGIGLATAGAFARQGAKVALADVQVEQGENAAAALKSEGLDVFFVKCDVSKVVDVEAMVGETVRRYGGLDYAFNNAGIEGVPAPAADCSEANWDKVIAINLKGVWLCMKYEIPELLKRGKGAIVNCASIAGVVGFANLPAYVASKHGVIGLTRNVALDYAQTGIRVNVVCPGVIDTPMVERFTAGNAQARSSLEQGAPQGRMGRPEEIADAVLWLCSDQASFVTGHPLVVDGGWVAR